MEIDTWIWSSIWIFELAWAARLWRQDLVRAYPFLTSYLLTSAAHSVASIIVLRFWAENPLVYGWLWTLSQPVLWILLFCVVIEGYKRMFSQYEGLRRLGELGEYVALGAVAVIVLGMILIDPVGDGTPKPWLQFWLRQERSVYFGLIVACLLLVSVRVYFKMAVPRNVLILFTVFGLMFTTHAALLVFRNFFGDSFRDARNMLAPLFYIGCLLIGAAAFSRAGEAQPEESNAVSQSGSAAAKVITNRLESFNQLLLKVLRS